MSEALLKRRKWLLPALVLAFCFCIALVVRETTLFFCNTDYGFGFLEPGPFLLLLEWGVLVGIAWVYSRVTRPVEQVFVGILLGAGLSNALERLLYGCVADFLTIPIIGSQVNIADVLITGTVLGLLFCSSKKSQ